MQDERVEVVEGWVRSQLPRAVALLGPAIAAGVAALTFWLQNIIGIDLQQYNGAAAAFIGLVLLGGISFGVTWLFNAGRGQIAIATKIAQELVDEGYRAQNQAPLPPGDNVEDPEGTLDHMGDDPVVPPGAGREPLE